MLEGRGSQRAARAVPMFSVLGRLLQFLSRIQQGRPETFGRNMLVSAIRRCGVTASQDIKRPKAYFQATRPCCTVLYYTRPKSMEHPPAFGKLVRKTPQMTNRLAVEDRCNWGRLRDSISRADPVSQDAVLRICRPNIEIGWSWNRCAQRQQFQRRQLGRPTTAEHWSILPVVQSCN